MFQPSIMNQENIMYQTYIFSIKRPHFLYTLDMFYYKFEPVEKNGIHGVSFYIHKVVPDVYPIYLNNNSKKNTMIFCDSPKCSNGILIPFTLKKRLSTTNAIKYSKISSSFCSKECREIHFKELSESGLFHLETTKNHKLSMCLSDFDLSERNKWKNEPILGRNKTEIRAKFLKLMIFSVEDRTGKNYMLSTEVSKFLANELPEGLIVTYKDTRIYSRRVMRKTVQLFPNEFRLKKNEKNILSIELIENDSNQ